jgi:hypothetical protein
MSARIVAPSAMLAAPANAQSIFSWFTSAPKKQDDTLFEQQNSASLIDKPKDATELHKVAFGEVVYHYFQEDYEQVLLLIEVGNTKHGFSALSQDNTDRLHLIEGAAQLKLGMYSASQAKFARLLSQTTSPYVQANTWFFMAKAGFDNKQAYLSEQAYKAIEKGQLREELTNDQWYELLYLSAYTRMQAQQNWQVLAEQIPTENIYSAYLLANHGTIVFNQSDYEQANAVFIQAKQALMTSQKGAQETQNIDEQDALFDRINVSLGQSLLQQGDLPNAIAVLQNIGDSGAESEQALLAFGWANAKENRWQKAVAAWQHLQENSVGLFSLQASYGIAYAFSQQDKLGQAFFALQSTASQIDTTIQALNDFAAITQQSDFFSTYNERWPIALSDLKLGFLAPTQTFDAKYLLSMRRQSQQIIANIQDKQARVVQLNSMLVERESSFDRRLHDMSLYTAKATIEQTQQSITNINNLLTQANTFEQQLALSKKMSDTTITGHTNRLNRAQLRHKRLANDTSRKRPIKSSYAERLARIEGILKWQLMDNYVAQRWDHQKLLAQAQAALHLAEAQYDNLQIIAQDQQMFSKQYGQFNALEGELSAQLNAATKVYSSATLALSNELLSIIDTRKAQLTQQAINTRLAMLRIQDLQQDEDK